MIPTSVDMPGHSAVLSKGPSRDYEKPKNLLSLINTEGSWGYMATQQLPIGRALWTTNRKLLRGVFLLAVR